MLFKKIGNWAYNNSKRFVLLLVGWCLLVGITFGIFLSCMPTDINRDVLLNEDGSYTFIYEGKFTPPKYKEVTVHCNTCNKDVVEYSNCIDDGDNIGICSNCLKRLKEQY